MSDDPLMNALFEALEVADVVVVLDSDEPGCHTNPSRGTLTTIIRVLGDRGYEITQKSERTSAT